MYTVIGSKPSDIEKLKLFNIKDKAPEVVIIPGYVSLKHSDKTYIEMVEIIKDATVEYLAKEYFENQKKLITINGHAKGKKLSITNNATYDMIIKCTGFSFKQWVRDNLVEMKQKLKDMEEVDSMKKELRRAEVQGITDKISEIKSDIEDALDMIGELSVNIEKLTGKSSERSTIIQVAKELKIPVKTSDMGDYYLVEYKDNARKHPKSTGRGGQLSWQINYWLSTLPPMTPSKPPKEIVTQCTDSYFRTVINKSPYYASYRRGHVTVYPAKIIDGMVYVGTTPIAPFSSTDAIEYLDLVLAPHGLTHDSVMGV